jgi:biotin-dependent carboxylase-like uncharacterized protein
VSIFEVLAAGVEATIQDRGRVGWRRFGVPPSGAMDQHAAEWANRLLDNSFDAPVLELLYSGARLRVLNDTWVAVTGADAAANVPLWRVSRAHKNEIISFREHRAGMWTYVAVEGGFQAERSFGSASVCRRAAIGTRVAAGSILSRSSQDFSLPSGVSGRLAPLHEQRDYSSPPALRVWRGPQWDLFTEKSRSTFLDAPWTVSSQSDRVGYRLTGAPLVASKHQLLSEPVLVGSVQVPENGQPIVTMRDGPTVGGYPKIAMVDSSDISWLAQSAPGQQIRFTVIK